MKYRDIRIVERRRSEKGQPRIDQRNPAADYDDELRKYQENTADELLKYERLAGTSDSRGGTYPPVEDLYVSYTGIEKIGVNPRSGYNTPLGVYSYPLSHVLRVIKNTGNAKDVEYMGDLPFVWVFTPRNPSSGLDIASYDEQRFKRDMSRLRQYMMSQGISPEEYDNLEKEATDSAFYFDETKAGPGISKLWNVTRLMGVTIARKKKMGDIKVDFGKGDFVEITPSYDNFPYDKPWNDKNKPQRIVAKVLKMDFDPAYEDTEPNALVVMIGYPDYKKQFGVPFKYLKKTEKPQNISKQEDINLSDKVIIIKPGHQYYKKIGTVSYISSYGTLEINLDNGAQLYDISYNDVEMYDPNKNYDNELKNTETLKFKIGDDANVTNPKGKKQYTVTGIETDGVIIQHKETGAVIKRSFAVFYKANPEYAPNTPTAPEPPETEFEPLGDAPKTSTVSKGVDANKAKELLNKGKASGVITYAELDAVYPSEIASVDEIEDFMSLASEMGIEIKESADPVHGMIVEWQKGRNKPAPKKTVEWNRIMRILGYEYATDSRGAGVIHDNEPHQAVFFSGKYIVPIEKIFNSEGKPSNEPPIPPKNIGPDVKYDRVEFERWFKKNFKSQSLWDYKDDSLELASPKLQSDLLKRDKNWGTKLASVSPIVKKEIRSNLEKLINDSGSKISDIMNAAETAAYFEVAYDFRKMRMRFADNPGLAKYYLQTFDQDARSFPEAEAALATDSEAASWYAINILQKRFEAGEPAIAKNTRNYMRYARYFDVRIPAAEEKIMGDPSKSAEYAIEILKTPWPEAEPIIMTDRQAYAKYRKEFPLYAEDKDVRAGTLVVYERYGKYILAKITKDGFENYYGDRGIEIEDVGTGDYGGLLTANQIMPLTKARNGIGLGDTVKVSADDPKDYVIVIDDREYNNFVLVEKGTNNEKVIPKTDIFMANLDRYETPKSGYVAGDWIVVTRPNTQQTGNLYQVHRANADEITVINQNGGYSYFDEHSVRQATAEDLKKLKS
jgi:hypothetical protein